MYCILSNENYSFCLLNSGISSLVFVSVVHCVSVSQYTPYYVYMPLNRHRILSIVVFLVLASLFFVQALQPALPRMASLAPPTSTAKPSLHCPNAPSEDSKTLHATLRDIQEKRLNTLRLYQEEKSLRTAESARAEGLAVQLDRLSTQTDTQNSQPYHVSSKKHQRTVIPAQVLLAELRTLGFLQDVPTASLTWHCLAMAEVFSKATKSASNNADSSPESIPQCAPDGNEVSSQHGEELTILKGRLKKAEEAAKAAKKAQQENEQLISRLKQQLDESTVACKGLIELVNEQEETIEKLS